MNALRLRRTRGLGLTVAGLVAATIGFPSSAALGAWGDNFDSYDTMRPLPVQSTWESWNNDPNAANFFASAAQAMSAPNSVEIDGADDAVHRYRGFTLGKWEFVTWIYVPPAMVETTYFILLNTYPAVNNQDWSLQVELDCQLGQVRDFNGPQTLPMTKAAWTQIRVIIDLDKDLQTCYYNGMHLVTKSWTAGVQPGGAARIHAVDLWANGSSQPVYYDNMALRPANLAMPSFSVDFQGPLMAVPDSVFGMPITEAEILLPPPPVFYPMPGPLLPPATVTWGGGPSPGPDLGLALWPAAVGHPAGVPGGVEVDALSYGTDYLLNPQDPWMPIWSFSVDEWAVGIAGMPPPSVWTEGALGAIEASADTFFDLIPPPSHGPFLPGPILPDLDIFDGNGLAPFGGPGYGLMEPHPWIPGQPDDGDNLDALDVDEPIAAQYAPFPVYFSLDAEFIDPAEGPPVNTNSAGAHGFVGGDVLVTTGPGAPPIVYAPARVLGLDLVDPSRDNTDDLDALILWENGDGVFQPSQQDFDWLGGGHDMLFFSVRRGSLVIGMPCSRFGAPIMEGDILTPPVVGGLSQFPGIWIPAEMIGLQTGRFGNEHDDLDALDLSPDCNMNRMPDIHDIFMGFEQDCNSNYVPDRCDIAAGTSQDTNANNIPDECECPEDLDASGRIDFGDILAILARWGAPGGPEDLDGSGIVDFGDILVVLAQWGPCPFSG